VIVVALLAAPLVWGGFQASGLALMFCLMALGWIAYLAAALPARRELALVRTPLDLPLALLLVTALASAAFVSVNHYRSTLEFYRLLTGAMLFWLIANQPSSVGRRRLYLGALILAAVAVSWLGAREYVVQRVLGSNPSWRVFATFFNPNELAGFVGLVVPLGVAAFLWSRSTAMRIIAGFATLLIIMGLLLTGSRGGWIAFAGGIFVFGLLAGVAFRRTRLALAVAVVTLVLMALVALAVTPLRLRLLGSFSGQQHSNMFRYLTWRGAELIAADHPWLGIGPGAFEFAYPRYAIGGFTRMAHQNYLQIAAEMGAPGAIAFGWMLGAFFWLAGRGFRRLRDRESRLLCAACIAGVLVFCLHSLLDYGWYIGAIQFTVFALFGLAANAAAPAAADTAARPDNQREPGARKQRGAPAPAMPAPLRVWRRSLRLTSAAAWMTVAVAAGVAALAAVGPVRAYLANAQRQQGRAAEGRGNLLTAESYYRAAVRLAPGSGEYHRDLGRVLGAPRGIAELERAIAREPTNALNYVVLAKLYDMVGPWNEAAAHYQRAIELYPNYLIAYRGLAELEARRGRPGNALTLYRRMIAIEHSPYERYRALEQRVEAEYAYAHYALGREALERGDARTARTELERALEILRRRKTQGAPMLKVLQAAGEYTPAIERELEALRARIWWRLAQLWERAGDRQKADSLRVQARQLAPEVARLVEEEPPLFLKPTPQTSNHGGAPTDVTSRSSTG